MKITRDIIGDLLPAYYSGEASSNTRDLVEDYFRQHPEYQSEIASASAVFRGIASLDSLTDESRGEKIALNRAKAILRWQQVLLAVASTFTLNAISLGFSFEIAADGIHIHWLSIPGQALMVTSILVISAVLWAAYIRVTRRIRSAILR